MIDPNAALAALAIAYMLQWAFFATYAWATTKEAQAMGRTIDRAFGRIDANFREIRHQRDTLAHLVDSGDLAGARELAGEILGGKG